MLLAQELLCELRKRHARFMRMGAVMGKPSLKFEPLPIRHGQRQRLRFGTIYQRFTQCILFCRGQMLKLLIDAGVHKRRLA